MCRDEPEARVRFAIHSLDSTATLRLQNGDFADAWRLVHSGGVKNQGRQSQRVAALLDELALTAAGWLFLFTALLAEAGAVESLSLKSRQTPADG